MDIETATNQRLPYLTADLPGIGGAIKRFNEDFLVEELPAYPACGDGTHVYFTIEKQGLTTPAAIGIIAKSLGRRSCDIGYAGMKDAHGVTRQTLSLEHIDPARIERLELARIRVLSVTLHTNKLKLGHLAGNRFEIKVRDTVASPLERVRAIFDVLARRGLPNYFGPQRFGARGDTAMIGVAVLRGDFDEAVALILGRPGKLDHGPVQTARECFDRGDLEEAAAAWPRGMAMQANMCRMLLKPGGDARKAWRVVDHTLRRLYVSAVQSDLFNRVLAMRIGSIDRIETGDLAWKHTNGACFRVEDGATEQPRCAAFEISPTGPLFGSRMTEAHGEPGRVEQEVLESTGLSSDQFRVEQAGKQSGARRPMRVPLIDASFDEGTDDRGPYVGLKFAIAPGAYATNLTREVCKADAAD